MAYRSNILQCRRIFVRYCRYQHFNYTTNNRDFDNDVNEFNKEIKSLFASEPSTINSKNHGPTLDEVEELDAEDSRYGEDIRFFNETTSNLISKKKKKKAHGNHKNTDSKVTSYEKKITKEMKIKNHVDIINGPLVFHKNYLTGTNELSEDLISSLNMQSKICSITLNISNTQSEIEMLNQLMNSEASIIILNPGFYSLDTKSLNTVLGLINTPLIVVDTFPRKEKMFSSMIWHRYISGFGGYSYNIALDAASKLLADD